MKQLLLILVLFSTSLSFSVTTEELARQIRSGSAEEGAEIYFKLHVGFFCWAFNAEVRCLASSNNTNEASTCIDKIKSSPEFILKKARKYFLEAVMEEEKSKRPITYENYKTKIATLKENPVEWKKFKENSYYDEVFSIYNQVDTLSEILISILPFYGNSFRKKGWGSLHYVTDDTLNKCSEKKEEEEFKCVRKAVVSQTKSINTRYSCHEF